jgi:aminoglycoside 6-adenylyltransferase
MEQVLLNPRGEKEMFDLILGVARADARVRAVYMNGSRANPNIEKDIYQDYDIVYVVTETASFLEDKNWISVFGDIAVVQEPDANDCGWGIHADYSRAYAWLMLFKDGTRIDLSIKITEEALSEYMSDSLTVPLLDKDGILPQIPPASEADYRVKKPTAEQYRGCCNEFWWCLNNVAKGLARDELPYAMHMFNVYVRDMLEKMIDWHIGVNTDFSVSPGKMGKFYKKFLRSELYQKYVSTYTDGDYDHFWAAVFAACGLFRELAVPVADCLGFSYRYDEDENMTEYLKKVKYTGERKA